MKQDPFFDDLAKIVTYHRKKSGLSRLALSRLAGVGKTVVYDIEHGKQTVRLETILKVLNTLNIRIEFTGPLMQAYREADNEKS